MANKRTEIVFILDRSESMNGLEKDTIKGFNKVIEQQKALNPETTVTTVLFDDQIDVIHDRFPIAIVKPLEEKDYSVKGCTALCDAVGMSIRKIDNIQDRLPVEMKAEKIIFVITTDGHDNSSKDYSVAEVKKMIDKKRSDGWEFLYFGADINAIKEAVKMGIDEKRAKSYINDSRGVILTYKTMNNILSQMCEN